VTLVLFLSGALLAVMAVVEFATFFRLRRITFLTAVHVLIAIGYCLPPFLIQLLPGTSWERGVTTAADPNPWGARLYILDLADHLNLPANTFISVGIILFGAYAVMAAAYFAVSHKGPSSLNSRGLSVPALTGIGIFLGLVSVAAMTLYASQFESFRHFIGTGMHIRNGTATAKWGSLQVLAQLALPSYLMLVAAALGAKGKWRAVLGLAACLVFAVGFIRILHVGGRIELGMYILTPVAALLFLTRSRTVAYLVAACIIMAVLMISNLPHAFGRNPLAFGLETLLNGVENFAHRIVFVVAEFAFPHIVSAHALTATPDPIALRYFIDIPLGLLYMLPNFTGVETLPPMVLSLHAKILPWIPVDLFSFGYFSLGTLGVLITFAAFGVLLALFDGWLSESVGWFGQALRTAWLFYLPFRLYYADPYAALQSGFGLITGTIVVIGLAMLARRTEKQQDRSAPS
tara:strand:+ start:445 stop:1827 length:1383 start_codon:yes stop_codon:yes gene_type:complete